MNASMILKRDSESKRLRIIFWGAKTRIAAIRKSVYSRKQGNCYLSLYTWGKKNSTFWCKYLEKGKYRNVCGNMTGSRCITQTCTVRLRKSSPSRNTENIINEEKHQLMYSLTAEVRHATELDTVALLFLSCPSAPNRSVGGERGAAAAARQFPSCPTVQAHCSAQQVLDSSHSVFNTIITLIY